MATWGDLLVALAGFNARPRYLIENYVNSVGDNVPSGEIKWASHPLPGYVTCIQRTGHAYHASTLTPADWSTTQSSMEIALAFPYGLDPRLPLISGTEPMRGALIQVKMGVAGWAAADYVVVYAGILADLRRTTKNNWKLILKSLQTLLVQRQSNTGTQVPLFFDYETGSAPTTTVRTNYSAGNTDIKLTASTGLERETGGNYAIQVTPNSGNKFIVTGSAIVAGPNMTIVASGKLGTTDANANTGKTVEFLYHVNDHPINIWRKILCSTGTGTNNATYDTLPDSWGLAIPQEMIDHEDCDDFIGLTTPTGKWRLADKVAVDDVLGWFNGWMNPHGFFITESLGKLTCRGIVEASDFIGDAASITDNDIISFDDYSTFNPDVMTEFNVVAYETYGILDSNGVGGLGEPLDTRPARYRFENTLEADGDTGIGVDTNISTWHQDILDRTADWLCRPSDVVTFKVAGLRWASLAPGARLFIYSDRITSREPVPGVAWFCLMCEPNFFEGYCTIVAAFVPLIA